MTNQNDMEYYRLYQNIHDAEDVLKKWEFARDSYLQFLGEQSLKEDKSHE